MLRRTIWRICGAAVGLTAVGLLVHALGPSHIAAYLAQLRWGFSLVLAAYLTSLTIYSLPLGLVLPSGMRPPLLSLVASRFGAVAVNAATPLLGLGGEPVRLLWFPPDDRHDGVAGIAIDRAAFLAASSLFLVAGTVAAAHFLKLPRAVAIALPSLGALVVVAAAALYLVQRHHGVIRPLARLVGVIAPVRGRRLLERAATIDARIRALHRARPGRFTLAIATHFLGRSASVLEVLAVAHLLGIAMTATGAFIFTALPLALDLAFSMVPSQIGVNEGAGALIAGALGLDPAAGVAISFVQRLRQVVFVALGFALITVRRGASLPSDGNRSDALNSRRG